MQEMVAEYSGTHEVLLNRNERNLGIGGHVNRLMELAKGELIVGAAGDDISLPERTYKTVNVWKSEDNVHSIYSLIRCIDEDGCECGFLDNPYQDSFNEPYFFVNNMFWVTGSSHAWSRDIFSFFGNINDDVVNEDMVIPFRSLLIGKIKYINDPLVKYRLNVGISSEKIKKNDTRIKEIPLKQSTRKIAVLKQYLSDLSKVNFHNHKLVITLVEKKIMQQLITIEFIENRGNLWLLMKGMVNKISWLYLLKTYLKHKLPKSFILLNYRIKGL